MLIWPSGAIINRPAVGEGNRVNDLRGMSKDAGPTRRSPMTRRKHQKSLTLGTDIDEALNRLGQADSSAVSTATGTSAEPVTLLEDDTGARFLIYATEAGVRQELRYEGDQPWFTQKQLADMFGVKVPTIIEHIQRFIGDGELVESTIRDFRVVRTEGSRQVDRPITHYSLDVAFYVGYRVNSSAGVLFRRWATAILIQFATKGFVVDKRRLEEPGNSGRIRELRQIIKELRASEANLYAELRDICAMCADYQPNSDAATQFYKFMQAKIFYAVTSLTPAAAIAARADANVENMGLLTWSGARGVTKKDVTVGKNYLADAELEEFSRLVTIVLDILDDQLRIGRIATMDECLARLDEELGRLGRAVLRKPGPPSKSNADAHALAEYDKFDQQRKLEKQQTAKSELATLKASARSMSASKQKAQKS